MERLQGGCQGGEEHHGGGPGESHKRRWAGDAEAGSLVGVCGGMFTAEGAPGAKTLESGVCRGPPRKVKE